MKKFLGLFIKGKQKQGNMYSLYDVSLPENDMLQKNAYRHYQFDSDCPNSTSSIMCQPDIGESNSASPLRPCILTSALSDLDAYCEKETEPSLSSISKSSSASSLNEVPSSVRQEQKPQLEGMKKSKKNKYVITINNSKYFHIGSQKTVNIREGAVPRVQGESQHFVEGHSPEVPACISQLIDCENKLSEEYILVISQHASDNWRQFLTDLGLEETLLEMLEKRNDNDKALTLYDGLQEYITLYPNTSLGFVINTLKSTQDTAVIKKLAQEINM